MDDGLAGNVDDGHLAAGVDKVGRGVDSNDGVVAVDADGRRLAAEGDGASGGGHGGVGDVDEANLAGLRIGVRKGGGVLRNPNRLGVGFSVGCDG